MATCLMPRVGVHVVVSTTRRLGPSTEAISRRRARGQDGRVQQWQV
jgi:hypothetical protein